METEYLKKINWLKNNIELYSKVKNIVKILAEEKANPKKIML